MIQGDVKMSKKSEIMKFKKLAKVLDVIFKIMFILLIVGFVGVTIGAVAINVIPSSMIDAGLKIGQGTGWAQGTFSISIMGTNAVIATDKIDAHSIKSLANISIFSAYLVIALSMFIVKQIRAILKNVLNETPFTNECVKNIRLLGFAIIAVSFIKGTAELVLYQALARLINLNDILLNSGYVKSINQNISFFDGTTILAGLLILLVAGIFKYGTYLQEEYDSTL